MRIPSLALSTAILSITASSPFALGGRILDSYGIGKSGVVVTAGGTSAITDAQGIWSIGTTNRIASRPLQSSVSASKGHIRLANGRLQLSFGGMDVAGRRLSPVSAPFSRIGERPVAARSAASTPDTFSYAWNGRVFLRDTTSDLTRGGIVAGFDTTLNASILYGWIVDARDGQIYRTVRIGAQAWMAQNLNFRIDSSSWYGNSADSGAKYGRLYPWAQALGLDDSCNSKACQALVPEKPQGICPAGWHVPSRNDWGKLLFQVDPADTARGKVLKSVGGWTRGGTDAFGFHAVPGGISFGDIYRSAGSDGIWKCATEEDDLTGCDRHLTEGSSVVYIGENDKTLRSSLRCVTDKPMYALKVSATGGMVALHPSQGPYDSGTVVTVTATSDSNQNFVGWAGVCTGASAVCSITMDSDKELIAQFSDIIVDPLSPRMKTIPAGTFTMGSPATEIRRTAFEETQHQVSLSAFLMDETDVTQGHYSELMGINPSSFSECGVTCPVENVTWFDAILYCNARSRKAGLDTVYSYVGMTGAYGNGVSALSGFVVRPERNGFRLPTEAQWEYAARAGTTTAFYWGNDTSIATAGKYAWIHFNSLSSTHPAATKPANAFGLYDMTGNVWQWTGDAYNAYPIAAATDPMSNGSENVRVNRGGSYKYALSNLRSAFRNYGGWDYASNDLGFRCVRPAP